MSSHDPRVTLGQIQVFGRQAQELCRETTLAELQADWRPAAALERMLECIGEAVKRLPAELRDRYPAVPWRKVTGMRDYICHGYDDLDYLVLWDAVHLHVPILLATVEQMLADLGGEPEAEPGA